MITIRQYQQRDTQQIIELVLHCQNDGSRPIRSVNDQPDLINITDKFLSNNGGFWVAMDDSKLCGCIGLVNHGDDCGIMKKFFVYEAYRGEPHHLGRQLYNVLLNHAQNIGIKNIILDTPKNTDRAHKFYLKAGFQLIDSSALPFKYSVPYSNCDYFMLTLN